MTHAQCATQRTASKRRARRAAAAPAAVLILALALAGCDTSVTVSPVDGTPDPETEEQRRGEYASHEEFRNQHGLARIKAHYAYARGATGEGVTLGIVDSGVDPDHPKFEGKLETSYVGDYDPDFGTCDEVGPDGACFSGLGHGTLVAGIMAAARQETPETDAAGGPPIHGVAFDAKVVSVGVGARDLEEVIDEIVAEYPEDPTPEQIEELQARVLDVEAQLERELERDTGIAFSRLNGRVTAVNCSFGVPGNIEDFDAQELRERFPNAIAAMAQSDTAAAERTIYVWAAGNAHGEIGPDGSPVSASSVEPLPGLSVRLPELRGHSLAVVATNPDGTIADFSNRCGIAKAFCLAAPGVDITGPAPAFHCEAGASQCFITVEEAGTSSAAPFVTGGIGLLAQHFRNQLGNDEIVERILATADKTGVYADADVYGQGFLDLDTATRPVGGQRMLTGVSLSGASSPEARSALYLGPAFGDSLARGLASAHVASFDELDAPFFHRLGDYLRPVGFAGSSLADRLRALGRDPRGRRGRWTGTTCRCASTSSRPRTVPMSVTAWPRSRRCRSCTTSAAAGLSSDTAAGWPRGSAWERRTSRRARSPTPAHSPIPISASPATGPALVWHRPWARAFFESRRSRPRGRTAAGEAGTARESRAASPSTASAGSPIRASRCRRDGCRKRTGRWGAGPTAPSARSGRGRSSRGSRRPVVWAGAGRCWGARMPVRTGRRMCARASCGGYRDSGAAPSRSAPSAGMSAEAATGWRSGCRSRCASRRGVHDCSGYRGGAPTDRSSWSRRI